ALAHALKGHAAGTVTDGRRRIEGAADHVRDGDRLALRFAGRVREAIDDRVAGVGKDLCRGLDRFLRTRLASVDQGEGPLLDAVLLEPSPSEHAGILRFDDLVCLVVHGQMHIVADAAAERAGRVAYDVCGT